MKKNTLTGRVFGRLKVVREEIGPHLKPSPHTRWLCECECGNKKVIFGTALLQGESNSCGCLRRELRTTHGHFSSGKQSKEYSTWSKMVWRCSASATGESRTHYYERGIVVCEEWKKFENFLEDMGPRPDNATLERVDNSIGYNKLNCKWATMLEQANNRRSNNLITFNGVTKTASEWGRVYNLKPHTIRARARSGWTVEDIFSAPMNSRWSR